MSKRNVYLTNVPPKEALAKYFASLQNCLMPKYEKISVTESFDRITAKAVNAECCLPLFNSAAMDGIAVRVSSTLGANESNPVRLYAKKDFVYVNTGEPVYSPYDAVIMIEDLIQIDEDSSCKILAGAVPNQHIRLRGEDITEGEMIVPPKHKIRPIDIGALLCGGITEIEVYTKPNTAILPTGSEIIEAGVTPKDGAIIESNSQMFAGMVTHSGGKAFCFKPIPDTLELLKKTIQNAANEYDLVIINGGSSSGEKDYTVQALHEIGEVIVHGTAMKPGKPVILAIVNNKPVIGTPGYPVSAYLSFVTFIQPVLSFLSGRHISSVQKIEAVLSKRIVSSLKACEYVRVKIGRDGDNFTASPLARGAGSVMSLVKADGFCVIPQKSEGIEAGETVMIELLRSLEEIECTLSTNNIMEIL
ncbi:MAG: molybdopterin-binding protein [Treponema sp.]|nr:molybdopterin-binding protein [Treponema sp.]